MFERHTYLYKRLNIFEYFQLYNLCLALFPADARIPALEGSLTEDDLSWKEKIRHGFELRLR